MKMRLEEMIMGPPNRQEFLQRNSRTKAPPSPIPDNNRKWHKSTFLRNAMTSGDSLSLLGVESNQSTTSSAHSKEPIFISFKCANDGYFHNLNIYDVTIFTYLVDIYNISFSLNTQIPLKVQTTISYSASAIRY